MPHSKLCDTFRAADCTAVGTQLGSPSLVGFNIPSPVPIFLIAELAAQHRPARIKNGLRHSGLREFGRADVANDDQCVVSSDTRGLLMQMVAPGVGDLGVERLDAARVVGALRDGERGLVSAVMLEGEDRGSIAADGKRLQAEIYADLTGARRQLVGDLALKRDIPAAPRILAEGTSLELTGDLAGLPEVELALEVDDVRAIDLQSARDKRDPPKGSLGATTGTKPGAPLVQIARSDELAAYSLHAVGVQAELGGAACAQLDQVEGGRPAHSKASLPTALSLALDLAAVVPDLIGRPGEAVEVLADRGVLDAVFERQHHASNHNWPEAQMQDYRTGRHCVFALHVHLVFVTKYRRDVLSVLAIRDLSVMFAKVCDDFNAKLIECNGEDDHVHLLVEYPPRVSISRLVNSLKGVSSRRLRAWRPEIRGRYFKGVLWSPSYFAASCGGAPITILRQYVVQQREDAPPPRPKRRGIRRGRH